MSVKRVQGLRVHKTHEIDLQRWNVQNLLKKNEIKKTDRLTHRSGKLQRYQLVEVSNRGYCPTPCSLGNIPMS